MPHIEEMHDVWMTLKSPQISGFHNHVVSNMDDMMGTSELENPTSLQQDRKHGDFF